MSQHQQPFSNIEGQTQQEPQKQTKSTSKKEHSYTYWVDDKNKSRVLPPQQRPQKIDPPKLVTQKSQDGRSDWNTAGTWEHRKVNISQIQKVYTERLNEWISKNCPQSKIKKVSLKGQCQVIFTRNKKTMTYQINGKVEFQKKLEQEKKEQNQVKQEQKSESNSNISDISNSDNTSSDKSPQKSVQSKTSTKKQKASKVKAQTMTFEIVELTDHGDRQYKSKADTTQDKKLISQKSQSLMSLLEQVLKSFKQK